MENKNQMHKARRLLLIGCLLVAAAVSGCATMAPPEPPVLAKHTLPPAPRELPSLRPLAELRPQVAMEDLMPFESRLFSLNILEAELQETILPMTRVAGLNLVFDREVDLRAPVSVSFTDLPLKQAMGDTPEYHTADRPSAQPFGRYQFADKMADDHFAANANGYAPRIGGNP